MKNKYLLLILPFCSFFFLQCEDDTQETSITYDKNTWATSRKDFAHTASINDTISMPLEVRWEIDLPVFPLSGIFATAVGTGNFVYIGADSIFYAINATTGEVSWTKQTDGFIKDAALIMARNKDTTGVYFTTSAATIYALNHSDGAAIWEVNHYSDPLVAQQITAPLNGGKGIFYSNITIPDNFARVNLLSAVDGSIEWSKDFTNTALITPVHGHGTVFCYGKTSTVESNIHYNAFDDDSGSPLWFFNEAFPEHDIENNFAFANRSTAGVFYSDVEAGDSMQIIFSTGLHPARVVSASVSSLDSPLKPAKWKTLLPPAEWVTGFSITRDRPDKCLIVSTTKGLYRFNPDSGEILWSVNFESNLFNVHRSPKPVIYGNYVFHVLDAGTRLAALDLNDGTEVWSFILDEPTTASPMIGDKTLYIGTGSGKFYAFSPGL